MIKISQTENMGNSKAHMRLTYTNKQYTEGEKKEGGVFSWRLRNFRVINNQMQYTDLFWILT